MKAIVQKSFKGIEDIEISDVDNYSGSIILDLIEVKYVPVLPWDIKTENGELNNIKLPKIIGYSFSGIIKKTGLLSSKNNVDKKVIGVSRKGTFSEYVSPEIPLFTFELPENVSLKEGATIFGGADTALMIINSLNLKSNDKVLLIGASGGVGNYLTQMLNLRNISTSIFSSKNGKEFLQQNFENKIYDNVNNVPLNGFNHIIDTSGNEELIHKLEISLKKKRRNIFLCIAFS